MNTVPYYERIPKPVAAVPPPEPTSGPIPAQQIPDNGKPND